MAPRRQEAGPAGRQDAGGGPRRPRAAGAGRGGGGGGGGRGRGRHAGQGEGGPAPEADAERGGLVQVRAFLFPALAPFFLLAAGKETNEGGKSRLDPTQGFFVTLARSLAGSSPRRRGALCERLTRPEDAERAYRTALALVCSGRLSRISALLRAFRRRPPGPSTPPPPPCVTCAAAHRCPMLLPSHCPLFLCVPLGLVPDLPGGARQALRRVGLG